MNSEERKKLIEQRNPHKIAARVATSYSRERWGIDTRTRCDDTKQHKYLEDPRYLEALSIAHYEVLRLLDGNPSYPEGSLFTFARKRVASELSHKGLCFNVPVREHDGVPLEEREYMQQYHPPETYFDKDRDEERAYDYFVDAPGIRYADRDQHLYNLIDQNPYSLCRNRFEREVVDWLTTTQFTQKQIADKLDIPKTRLEDTIRDIKQRELMTNNGRKPRTADPRSLHKVRPLPHDNCMKDSGSPVIRMKDQICETEMDGMLIDLYRDGQSFERIAAEVKTTADSVKERLGILAHRYLEM